MDPDTLREYLIGLQQNMIYGTVIHDVGRLEPQSTRGWVAIGEDFVAIIADRAVPINEQKRTIVFRERVYAIDLEERE